ncbi:MAG TPA: HEAT repeat domain-containing protein [Bryobacteraceae bacterium]|nr:HEAT repeat domain-containing protein [Bryobacteraceae bacterium]
MMPQNGLLKMETSVWMIAQRGHWSPGNRRDKFLGFFFCDTLTSILSSGTEAEKACKLARYLEGDGSQTMAERWQELRSTSVLDERSYTRLLLALYRAESSEVAHQAVDEIKAMTYEGHFRRPWRCPLECPNTLGAAEASDLLIAALSSKNASARSDAAERLGAIGHKAAIEPLRLLTRDHDSRVREAAAVALAKLNDATGIDILLEMLGGPSGDAAAHVLLRSGEKRAIPFLREILSNTTWRSGSSSRKTCQIVLDGLEWLNDPAYLKENDAYGYMVRGYLKKSKGDLDGAIADFTRAIELSPQCGDAYRYRWEARHANGEVDDAKADLVIAFRLRSFC